MNVRLLILLMVFLISFCTEAANKMRVVFINPGYADTNDSGDFWPNVTGFMHAAAEDLNIELISMHAERNHIRMKALVEKAVSLSPSYLILVNEKEMLPQMISQLEGTDIKVFLLLNKFTEQQKKAMPEPLLSYVIGCVSPNNREVGEQLADALIQLGKQKLAGNITMLTLLGDYNTPASIARTQGLKASLAKNKDVTLLDSPVANWSEKQAFDKTFGILSKHHADVIWAANDAMAFGAVKALRVLKRREHVVVGGINWDSHQDELELDVSYGGHVLLGAKALLMLEDYHFHPQQHDSMSHVVAIFEKGPKKLRTDFQKLIAEKRFNEIDFVHFSSKTPSPKLFTIQNVMNTRNGQ